MNSIRGTLIRLLLPALFLLLLAGGAAVYLYVHATLVHQFDSTLETEARLVINSVEVEVDELEFELTGHARESIPPMVIHGLYRIWIRDGPTFTSSRDLTFELPDRVGELGTPLYYNARLPTGHFRVIGTSFFPRVEREARVDDSHPMCIVMARDRRDLDQSLSALFWGILAIGAVTLVATGIIVHFCVARGLAPLEVLATHAAGLDATDLGSQFPREHVPAELLPVTDQLNNLLGRLDHAFRRERRLTADMAHELRTPIAELRSLAEVALKWPGDDAAANRGFQDALAVALQMERLVNTLLMLARCDAGEEIIEREEVPLAEAVEDAWRPLADAAAARGIRARFDVQAVPSLHTDRTLLQSILANLLANAAQYAPQSGEVSARAESHNGTVRLSVTNSNESLKQSDLAHIFEPLWRKDSARTSGGNSGLGLTLVRAIARVLGGDVAARLEKTGEFTIEVSLPRQPSGN